jgi:hypothetical protein
MGNQASRIQEGSPLACLLKHCKDLDPESLQQKFYRTQSWPQYPLGDEERWPEGGSINYNTILQLGMFCKKDRKWTKVPYVQLFFFLRDHPEWLNKCRLDTQTMVTLCKNPPNSLEPKTHLMLHQLPLFPLTQLPHTQTLSHRTLSPPVNCWRGQSSCSF